MIYIIFITGILIFFAASLWFNRVIEKKGDEVAEQYAASKPVSNEDEEERNEAPSFKKADSGRAYDLL